MKIIRFLFFIVFVLVLQSCGSSRKTSNNNSGKSNNINDIKSTVIIKNNPARRTLNVKDVQPGELVNFALSLLGVPYKYGSIKKEDGFDCSGFINYVFNHYKISVPRTTVEFTNAGKEILFSESRPGDIILFTGSNASSGVVGHMGIVTKHDKKDFRFIHSASGNNIGVIVSEMNSYFIPRFVKIIRVFLP